MRVAVPTQGGGGLEDTVGEHFGRTPTYTLVDPDSMEAEVIENISHHMGGAGYPPELLEKHGVNVLLCRGLGRRAIQMFSEKGIGVYCEASGTVEDALRQWRNNELVKATEDTACSRHEFRGRDHGTEKCGH